MSDSIKHHRWYRASWVPSPNFNDRPNPSDIVLIVIHNISLPPGEFGGGFVQDFFQNQLDHDCHPSFNDIKKLKVSAHLLIDREGRVTQFVAFDKRAWHAGVSQYGGRNNCNDFSIGVELEGTDELPFTDAQYASLVEVIVDLVHYYPDLSTERITGHSDIAPGRKTDPGPCFDWKRLSEQLAQSGV